MPLFSMFKGANIKSRFNQGWKHMLFGNETVFDETNLDEHYQKMKAYKPIPQWW